jgi:regulator of sirC expression with transglutaminase-like and TPR domain
MTNARAALEAIGQLPDAEIDIAGAALQLARIDAPDADWHAARDHLSELARDAAALADDVAEDDLPARAGALAGLLAGRHGYRGDTADYDNPANANLIRVIERRRGLPVALGILWLHAARAARWPAQGLDFPGHFLLALEGSVGHVVMDVFAGGAALDVAGLRALLRRAEGAKAELRPELLAPMPARGVLLRLQNNIKLRRLRGNDVEGALVAAEDMLRIAPHDALLWREAGQLNEQLERVAAALRCFERFLQLVPTGEAATRTRAAINELRSRLN